MTINDINATILEVLVFKTNISSEREFQKLTQILDPEKKISRWNIDRDDIDKVLRVEGDKIDPGYIVSLICDAGFRCEELPD